MPKTIRICQIASCNREAATLCYHCQQEVCRTHFAQHNSMIRSDIYSLADLIDIITGNVTTFSIAPLRNSLLDVDKLLTPTIQIETYPANLNTGRIISMDQVSHNQSENVSDSISKIHINDDIRYSNRPAHRYHSSTSQSILTIENSNSEPSLPDFDSLPTVYPPYVPLSMSISVPLLPPLPSLPIQPRIADPRSSIHRSPESIYQQRSSFTSPAHFTYEPSPYNFSLPYLPLK
jgi:hypothetical protein